MGKTHRKSSCPVNKNFQKSWCPVSGGKEKSMSRIIILYSHCVGGATCNDQRSLPLTTGGLGGAVSPQQVQGPGRGPGGKALEALKPLHFIESERV